MRLDRIWNGTLVVLVATAFVIELILTVTGASILVTERPPALGARLFHLVSYFTIQANALVLVTSAVLLRDPGVRTDGWRVLRLSALVGIVVTGLVHFFLLRPLLDLTGWANVGDLILHVIVPTLTLVGWLSFGPRPRVDGRTFGLSLIWPVAWLVVTLIVGVVTGWYPYPFLNLDQFGGAMVAVNCVGIAVLFVALTAVAWVADRRLAPR